MQKSPSLSIVTVSMNRTVHVVESARCASTSRLHDEHIILDYGSSVAVSRDQLPNDDRIKLYRCRPPSGEWWLTHAYNLAFSLANSEYILKLDADILLTADFIAGVLEDIQEAHVDLMCSRLTLQDWSLPADNFNTNGLFLCRRESLYRIGGFNPYIQGWGWDEIDLYSRFFLHSCSLKRLPLSGVGVISHGNELRVDTIPKPPRKAVYVARGQLELVGVGRRLQVLNERNRQIALASIAQGIHWPTSHDYREAFRRHSGLPPLDRIPLFQGKEKDVLLLHLVKLLLRPSRTQDAYWRLLKVFGLGPYTNSGAESLLASYKINLSLVA